MAASGESGEAKVTANLPWIEKYRPATLDDLISHKDTIKTIQRFLDGGKLPHLLFYGPPGTGKTSTILALARQIYSAREFGSMVLELNASDDRGIGIVRGPVFNFASTKTVFNRGFKLVILDEADAMTRDAQNALRRIMEKYTANARFCLIGNYLSKIIPAVQSRCTRFRFAPLTPENMLPRLQDVIDAEGVTVTEDGKEALLRLAEGDMRRALNILQSAWMSQPDSPVTEERVYTCVGHPLTSDIKAAMGWMLNEPLTDAFGKLRRLQNLKGLAVADLLSEVAAYVVRGMEVELPPAVVIYLLRELADAEHRVAAGTSERIQLAALVAVFANARQMLVEEGERAPTAS